MKINMACIILIALLGITVSASIAQQNQNVPKTDTEVEKLKIQLQTLENEKIGLETKLAEAKAKHAAAYAKLIETEFDKLKLELKDSNEKWLLGWIGFFGVMFAVFGVALWFVVKSMIANRVEENLKGFQESVEQVKIQQERIRIIEREYAALMLAEPDKYSDDEGYVYPETVRSLSEQTVLDVIYHKTYSIYVRIRAAEILKKRNPVRSLPVLLEMVNSFLDTDIYKDEDIYTVWHLRDLVPLFKDIHNDKTYRGLSKLLARVLKSKEDTELKKAYLNWILFSLAYVGDGLNTESAISRMREALPNLLISNEDSHNLENLVNYFDKFQEHEGIMDILTNGLTEGMPDVETRCLQLLEKHDPDFVNEWKAQKEATNTEREESDESKPTT